MDDKQQDWVKTTWEFIKQFVLMALAFGYNGVLLYMTVQGRVSELNSVFWGVYGSVMAVFGIPVANQLVQTARHMLTKKEDI